jgi:FemAB-related protein (PEP-CTERM system-associated)
MRYYGRTVNPIQIIDGGDQPQRWDHFVTAADASTFCHQAGWQTIMTDVLRHECQYLAAVDDAGEWRGILPLVRVRSALGHYLISLPFLNDGGPLGDRAAQQALVEHAVTEAKRSGAGLLELRAREVVPGPVNPSHRRIAVHLSLPASVEGLWKTTLRAKLRSQIRRPAKEGMTFRVGADELEAFYEVFTHNMRDLGTPVLPRSFFERVASTFGDRVIFAVVLTKTGSPAAAACCFHWRNELEVMWASSLRKLNRLSPNMLLYGSLMEDAIERGVRDFNFGRSVPGGATHRFKQQWGGRDVSLPWPSWSRHATASVPSTDRKIYRVAIAVWKHLPIAVANRLGPPLARLLP